MTPMRRLSAAAVSAAFQQLLSKARDAAAGGEAAWATQSTGERLAVALVLNRFDWLDKMAYTIPEAIDRVGPDWVGMIPTVSKMIQDVHFISK